MFRTMQMVYANALRRHHLGPLQCSEEDTYDDENGENDDGDIGLSERETSRTIFGQEDFHTVGVESLPQNQPVCFHRRRRRKKNVYRLQRRDETREEVERMVSDEIWQCSYISLFLFSLFADDTILKTTRRRIFIDNSDAIHLLQNPFFPELSIFT